MLRTEPLDAVSVITPNKFHCPLVLQALAAGKHVFCEKPPALNAKETQRMVAAAKRADRTLMFNFNNRARPAAAPASPASAAGSPRRRCRAEAR